MTETTRELPWRLLHADATTGLRTLEDQSVDLIITSPPYYNAKSYGATWEDFSSYESYAGAVGQWIGDMVRVLKPGRMLCVNISPVLEPRIARNKRSRRFNLPYVVTHALEQSGMWFAENITWAKPEGAAVNRNQRFSVDRHPLQWRANPVTEQIIVYQKPTPELNDVIIRRYGGVGRVDGAFARSDLWHITPNFSPNHPAPFPLEIPARLIRYYSWPGDVVLDPFVGSGTTGVAALQLGRKFVGIDQEPSYLAAAQDLFCAI